MAGNGPADEAVGAIAGEIGGRGSGIRVRGCGGEAADHGQLSQRRRWAEPTEVVYREGGRARLMDGYAVIDAVPIDCLVVVVVVVVGRRGAEGVAKVVVVVLETGSV